MHRFKNHFLLYLFSLILLSWPAAANAPATELISVETGKPQALSDYIGKGKWVLVNVWSPTCTACVKELPAIEAFRKKHIDDVQMLGVTIDFPSFGYGKIDIINEFLETNPIHYPLFLADMDMASDVIGNWLVAIPLMAIFHPDGRVLARWPGYVDIEEIEEFMQNYKDYVQDDALSVDF